MMGKRRIRRRWILLALLAAMAGGAAWWYFGCYRPSRVDVQIADFLAEPNRRNAERLAASFIACRGTNAERSEILRLLTFPRVVTRSSYPADQDAWIALGPSPWAGLLASVGPAVQLQPPSDGVWEWCASVYPDGRVAGPSFPDVLVPFSPQDVRYLGVRREDVAPGPWVRELPILCFAFPLESKGWAWPSSRPGWMRWVPRREKPMGGRYDSFRQVVQVELNVVQPGKGEAINRLEGTDVADGVRRAFRLEPPEVVYPPPGSPLQTPPWSLVWRDLPVDCAFQISYRGLEGVRGQANTAILLRSGSSGRLDTFASVYQSRAWTPYWGFERPDTPDGYTGAIILTPDFETAWMFPEVKAICAETIELPVKVTVLAPPAASRPTQAGRSE